MESTRATDPKQAAACEGCGSFDALEIGGKFLCPDCVERAGCGCAGAEADNAD